MEYGKSTLGMNSKSIDEACIHDSLLDSVHIAIRVLSEPSVNQYFQDDIRWLQDRHFQWENSRMRVALMGVTSTGKSTLLNAFLRADVLPRRVRPSSNTLVICRHGTENSARVHFEDGKSETYTGERIKDNLARLADEEHNPGNMLGVYEIEILSQEFMFEKDIEIVDTPGLDAYGLKRHEELTLQTLLPSVDAVLFMTDTKSGSDERISFYLTNVQQNDKRMFLIQNKIDSIEPEMGEGGVVRKDKNAVARDHLDRLARIVDRVTGKAGSTPIVQVSAIEALKNGPVGSGLPELKRVLESHLRSIMPVVTKGRLSVLVKRFDSLIEREKASSLNEYKDSITKERMELEDVSRDVNQFKSGLKSFVSEKRKEVELESQEFETRVNTLTRKDTEAANAFVEEFSAWLKRDPLSQILRTIQQDYARIAARLDLTERDLKIHLPHTPVYRRVDVKEEEKRRETKVKKGGIINSIKRLFGSVSGYSISVETWKEVDLVDLCKKVSEETQRMWLWMENAACVLENELEIRCNSLETELGRRTTSVSEKAKATVPLELRHKAAENLEPIQAELKQNLSALKIHDIGEQDQILRPFPERYVDVSVPASKLLILINKIAETRYIAVRNFHLAQVAAAVSENVTKNIVVIGFDLDSMKEFMERFWPEFEVSLDEPGVFTKAKICPGFDNLHAIVLTEALAKSQEIALPEPTTLILLLDAEKPGATQNALSRSPLVSSLLASGCGFIACVQSMTALSNSGAECEMEAISAIVNMFGTEDFPNPHTVMANDERVYVSVLLDYLNRYGSEINTVKDEILALKRIKAAIPECYHMSCYDDHIGRCLHIWRNQKSSSLNEGLYR